LEKKIMKNWMKSRKWAILQIPAWILMIGLLAGCASSPEARQNLGTLRLSSEVSQIFETHQVLPNHRYYVSGSNTRPDAIIGIDQNYSLDTRLWREAADLGSEQLRRWVDQINGFRPPTRTLGSAILSANGEQVGVWYSHFNSTTVRVEANNQIMVFPPNQSRRPPTSKGWTGTGGF
jgi:hypothetical protein